MLKYAMSHSDTIKERNKASDNLISSCENNIVNRDLTNIMDMVIKKISKTHFVTKSGTIM